MSFLLGQIVGFVGGLVACWAFWRFLLVVKPKVEVARCAAHCQTSGYLGVKIANRGERQVTDVEVRMAVAERTPDGRIIIRLDGELNASTLFALEPKSTIDKPWTLPSAFVFAAINGDDIMRCLKSELPPGIERRLFLTLNMRDGYSGTKVVKFTTFNLRMIRNGWYDPKLSLDVGADRIYEPSVETSHAIG